MTLTWERTDVGLGAMSNGDFSLMCKIFNFLQGGASHVLLEWFKMNTFLKGKEDRSVTRRLGPIKLEGRFCYKGGSSELLPAMPADCAQTHKAEQKKDLG